MCAHFRCYDLSWKTFPSRRLHKVICLGLTLWMGSWTAGDRWTLSWPWALDQVLWMDRNWKGGLQSKESFFIVTQYKRVGSTQILVHKKRENMLFTYSLSGHGSEVQRTLVSLLTCNKCVDLFLSFYSTEAWKSVAFHGQDARTI